MRSINNEVWQVAIFMIEDKANHCGLILPGAMLADLSLRGARIVPLTGPALPKGERFFYDIVVENPDMAIDFLQQPGELALPIIREEKKMRGWHVTVDAPDFVRTFHSKRSLDPGDMNCVEWIVRALELGGVDGLDDQILTPTELHQWCRARGLTPH